jgi:hypothetical protein
VLNKLQDILDDIKVTIEWILAGCPKPVPIPIKERDDDQKGRRPQHPPSGR